MAEGFGFPYLKTFFSDLDILHEHVRKISALKKLLTLALAGQEQSPKCVISKIREQIVILHGLLNKMESDYQENIKKTTLLKELQDTAEKEQKEAQHFLKVLPRSFRYRRSCDLGQALKRDEMQLRTETECTEASGKSEFPSNTSEVNGDVQQVPSDFGKIKKRAERPLGKEAKHGKSFHLTGLPKEMRAVTSEDLEEIPSYMKGRITCDQVNAVVKNLNKAMMTKYRIRSQPLKSMNTAERELYYRYIREEHENNEGACFVVEDDIKLFTHMKLDKRFHQIITILRHCQRLKEIRISGAVRYATW